MELKKKVLLVLFLIISILNIYNVYAGLGITPASTNVYFQPNMSFLVSFAVLNAQPDTNLLVYADGDLSEYVKFDNTSITGPGSFTAYIDLPSYVNKSGKNRLYIKVKENNAAGEGISVALEVGALILIKVPYPGKYAEINSFSAGNVNEGEPVYFSAELNNLGTEEINPDVKVDVYSNGKIFGSYSLGTKKIEPNSMELFETKVSDKKYKSGSYEAFLSIRLNDENNTILRDNKSFFVGNLIVDIIDWTREVNMSKISPFDIEIESKWNNDIKNIYAEINLTNDEMQADFFKTPSIELKRWETGNLRGFLNAENLEEGKYKANITLFYEDKSTTKITNIKVVSPETPKKEFMLIIYISIIAGVAVIIMIITFYLILIRRIHKLEDSGKVRNRKMKNSNNKYSHARKNT